ncbi:hypothetical protein ACFYYR_25020 [Streptomyces sp. NPDC001922]|uniref:hypothetical protein n=1 Tax=Streptomyces sp. NPDC001922 TaxID=3364624 RepID=UPI0036A9907A
MATSPTETRHSGWSIDIPMVILALLNQSGARIGTSLNVTRTVQGLASLAVPRFADSVSVDLLDSVPWGKEPSPDPADAAVVLRRTPTSPWSSATEQRLPAD